MTDTLLNPDQVLQSLFEKRTGRPYSAWKNLRACFNEFTQKPLSGQTETLKQIASGIAYLRGAEALEAAFRRKKADYPLIQQFGVCFDKLVGTGENELTVKIPAKLLGSFSAAIVIRSSPQSALETPDAIPD